MFTAEQAKQLADQVLKFSSFPECTVEINSSEQAYTRFANNGITLASFANRRSVAINSTKDGKTGSTQVNEFEPDKLREAVKRSEELAAIAPANPEHKAPPGPQEFAQTSDYDEQTAKARAPEMIPQIKAVIDAAVAKKLVAAGLFERTLRTSAVSNKAGLFGFHRSADSHMSTTIRMADGSSSGWAGQPSVRIEAIDGKAMADRAIQKCLAWKNPQRIEPGKFTVVLEPTAAGDLVNLVTMALSARTSEEGRGYFSKKGGGTKLGEQVFPEKITLRTDPFNPLQPAAPWTNELLPTRAITWVEKGIVKNLFTDRYWAEKTGKQPTPFPNPLYMDGGEASLDELIAGVERGLLVTHFWYIRFVNPQTLQYTGLTRDGLFLIENGKIAAPVMNLRFTDSSARLLQNAKKLGKPVRVRGLEGGMMVAPAIVADDFAFTSISDAV